ncbi:hypothetical protein PHYPSEUDO_013721 [Phytophthora pseudosyringae]|uniref:Uncharacterized protein n=1 Tax=Phytophthora pseudosyringae TaxID=221518 RepID=A0A8T1V5N8_9STRA|nr:hypothetical protein PHYPSEUDO_013721 [Phytophthora pseudosyringae]
MVRPRGKVTHASDVKPRDLSFRSVWREQKAQRWTNKRPPSRSLDDRFRYSRPGCSPDGAEGVNFLLGEEAVLEYYANKKGDLGDGEDSGEDCADTYLTEDDDEPEATETEIAAEVLFAERFRDRFGGEDQVLSGNLKNDVLRKMSASGWEDAEEPDTDG